MVSSWGWDIRIQRWPGRLGHKDKDKKVQVKPTTPENTRWLSLLGLFFLSLDALQTHISQAKSLLNQLSPILSDYKSLKWDVPVHF